VTARNKQGFPTSYEINADPKKPGSTATMHYFTDQSGVIRLEPDHPANRNSTDIEKYEASVPSETSQGKSLTDFLPLQGGCTQ
jgi:hypothetical protein